MIKGTYPVFAVCSLSPTESYHEPGIDLRTWMATQLKVAYIIKGGTTREQRDQWAVEETDSLIAELNKQPAP